MKRDRGQPFDLTFVGRGRPVGERLAIHGACLAALAIVIVLCDVLFAPSELVLGCITVVACIGVTIAAARVFPGR